MQARPEVRDGFKEREVARLERTSGVWTGEVIHISDYVARRFRYTGPGQVQEPSVGERWYPLPFFQEFPRVRFACCPLLGWPDQIRVSQSEPLSVGWLHCRQLGLRLLRMVSRHHL